MGSFKIKIINILTIIVFLASLVIPFIVSNKKMNSVSAVENRYLANFPTIFDQNGNFSPSKFVKDFQLWLTDNIGFRNSASDILTNVYYKLWKESASSSTLLGKNDWMYFYNEDMLIDYTNSFVPDEQKLKNLGERFENINKLAQKYNIPVVNLLMPDKKTAYPENYPESIKKVSDKSISDYLIQYLKSKNIDIMYPLKQLVGGKSIADTYSPRIDTSHYNAFGAFITYTEFMKKAKTLIPNLKISTLDDYNVSDVEVNGLFNGAIPISEITKKFELKKQSTAQYIENYFADKPNEQTQLAYYKRYENTDKSLPKILIFGDSYIHANNFMLSFLKENFSNVTFVHNSGADKFAEYYIEKEKPDIILYEIVERLLYTDLK